MRPDPLYHLIDWTWRKTPGFRLLHDDTKAIISYLLFNLTLVGGMVVLYWSKGLL